MKRWNIKDQNNKRHGLVINADCVLALQGMETNSVDSIVTDPPYEIGFMGKGHDSTGITYDVEMWKECLRVLKPGGHLLSFGATKTYHRMACAVEDAGFEIRDAIFWCYGSGFPKSQNIGKAIDKAAGATREQVPATGGLHKNASLNDDGWAKIGLDSPTMAGPNAVTPEAQQWDGWGTALKPAVEPIVVARKPLSEKTVAKNVLKHGTGGINIDGTRVGTETLTNPSAGNKAGTDALNMSKYGIPKNVPATTVTGRWPANLFLGHSEGCKGKCVDDCPVANLDKQSGTLKSGKPGTRRKPHQTGSMSGTLNTTGELEKGYGDSGGGSRFFHNFQMESPLIYQAKANKKERPLVDGQGHGTVKPLALMQNLVRLVTPPGGTVLDPFGGSGTTGEAALLEGFRTILIEQDPDYCKLIEVRLNRNQYVMVKRVVLKSRKPKRRIVRRKTR